MASEEILSKEELSALLEGMAKGKAWTSETDEEVLPYDLVSPENAIAIILPILETIHERFAHGIRLELFEVLRREVKIVVNAIELKGYPEFTASLGAPCSINIIEMPPLRGPGMLIFEQQLVFLAVEKFFGGTGNLQSVRNSRDFTATEMRLIQRLAKLAYKSLADAWRPFAPVNCHELGAENSPQFVTAINPAETLVVASLHIIVDNLGGNLHLALPYSMFESVRRNMLASRKKKYHAQDERLTYLLQEGVKDSQVEACCVLAETELVLGELLSLRIGDVIPLEISPQATLRVEGIPLYSGQYGLTKGWRAIKIEQTFAPQKDRVQAAKKRTNS